MTIEDSSKTYYMTVYQHHDGDGQQIQRVSNKYTDANKMFQLYDIVYADEYKSKMHSSFGFPVNKPFMVMATGSSNPMLVLEVFHVNSMDSNTNLRIDQV